MTKASISVPPAQSIASCPAGKSPALHKVQSIVRHYLQLAKMGIVFGNLVSVAGGFFLASRGHINLPLFLATVAGVSLVVASGCAFNNYIDRDIDAKMRRTQSRVLVLGLVPPAAALAYGFLLGLAGLTLLYLEVNALSAFLVILGFIVYVGVYSLYMKRHSVFGTLIGSLSGAMPPVIGYCAVSNHFDMGAGLLLLIFSLWQMPHSYAIGILYLKDYGDAGIPVLPVKFGVAAAKKRIVWYIAAFTILAPMLTVAGYTGYGYFIVAAATGIYWLYAALSNYRIKNDQVWARKMFILSIVSIMVLSVMMSVDFCAPRADLISRLLQP
jgi:protoheme IX farnesyltransferase